MTATEAIARIEEKISNLWDEAALTACQHATASGRIPDDRLTDELWRLLQKSEAEKIGWLKRMRPEFERMVREADASFKEAHNGE